MSSMSIRHLGSAVRSACRLEAAAAPVLTAAAGAATPFVRPPLLLRAPALLRFYAAADKEADKPADKAAQESAAGQAASADGGKDGSAAASDAADGDSEPSVQDLISQIKTKEDQAAKLTSQVEALTDSLKRTLAEMENLRMRTAREVDVSKKFAIQGFVKAVLDVPDNLERAAGVVPAEALKEDGSLPPEKLRGLLSGLLEGVRATENIMLKVLKQHGVERYDPAGQPFDPNLHNALFDVPDPSKENNTIAMVTKKGYKLNERVIRPAEVGVVRNP